MSYRSALPSSKKTHSERNKQILKQLLKEEANRSCADCKITKNPRWASWNLGCFICIRCSGIHRSMGTHISKVKSVDLDAWTDDQIESMVQWGNEKCNMFWEEKLPEGYVPDQSKIENFIRTKYDMKKWCSSPHNIPNPATIRKRTVAKPDATANANPDSSKPTSQENHVNLLDNDFGHFMSTSEKSTPPPPPTQRQQPTVSTKPLQFQSAQSTGGSMSSNSRPDLKKSILSLYASPSSSNSFLQPPQPPPPPPQQPQQQQRTNSQLTSLSDSLAGLQFHQQSSTSKIYQNVNPIKKQTDPNGSLAKVTRSSWTNNDWNDSSSSISSSHKSTAIGLDDDLFKNVWS
ncbi:AGE2 [Candida oxycetoniae]|uniref:AGE2 n=1 Tax=Candida oxycetoniae TaxID=497107 RepID=A0AAI9SV33_9ASCO|nr:AGE2 [Candida oxycetoniae]KAI3403421.2 AGE2 [Candida oxycetoniae]